MKKFAFYRTIIRLCSFSVNSTYISQNINLTCKRSFNLHLPAMSKTSKYEYVKKFETEDRLIPNCWMVVRIDGKGFHRFSDTHGFTKPNDVKALNLMNACAEHVMNEFTDVVISYGQSDEYSFVFRRQTDLYGRRAAKITTNIVSLFASAYVFKWNTFFPLTELKYPPAFDARVVLYPTNENLRDYLSWRQVDCHINNLYNTVFWALVQQGKLSNNEAQQRLKGSVSGDKNEILFSEFNMNYNNEPDQFKKGTTIFRKKVEIPIEASVNDNFGLNDEKNVFNEQNERNIDKEGSSSDKRKKIKQDETQMKIRTKIVQVNCDIIRDDFWTENSHVLGN